MSPLTVLAQADTIPDDAGGPYVIAAYVVFLVITVVYLAIMAQRLTKVSRQADEIQARLDRADAARAAADSAPPPAVTSAEAAGEVAKTPEGVA